jgi:hypothetical protein
MREEGRPLPHQVGAAAQQVAGFAHALGVDRGEREVAAAQQAGDLVGVDLVVLGLGAVDELQVQGVTQCEGDVLFRAAIGEPIPGEHAFGAADEVVAEGGDGFEEGLGSGGDVGVEGAGAGLVEDAQVQRPGVQVAAAGESVCLVVIAHAHGLRGMGGPDPATWSEGAPFRKNPRLGQGTTLIPDGNWDRLAPIPSRP